ncbi:uncharacterized protein ATNIH1004_007171 [Aspergillus tanneri]|uniref:Uncharacterized protein n=1 Tax=Aspergillus tanneri TaxID=1220188 RepID=A0A5M9MFJ9_9EURO|nr:uncharacterized protein ATNIH1004_007171 [Aspergillus tanneri]KAA8645752.1 hypothetical protein ATNIH1004_007171 [Aspergillus tanneri]
MLVNGKYSDAFSWEKKIEQALSQLDNLEAYIKKTVAELPDEPGLIVEVIIDTCWTNNILVAALDKA